MYSKCHDGNSAVISVWRQTSARDVRLYDEMRDLLIGWGEGVMSREQRGGMHMYNLEAGKGGSMQELAAGLPGSVPGKVPGPFSGNSPSPSWRYARHR